MDPPWAGDVEAINAWRVSMASIVPLPQVPDFRSDQVAFAAQANQTGWIIDQIAPGQPTRFKGQSPSPFQTVVAGPIGSPLHASGEKVHDRSECEKYIRPGCRSVLGHPQFLTWFA